MNESITNRVGRLISGSVNSIIDAMEGSLPETVMKEAIREVEAAIDEVRAELGKEIAGQHLANQRLAKENQKLEELNAKTEIAIQQDRDDLAQAAISRVLNIEAQLPVLKQAIANRSQREKELEGYILALRGRKAEMEEEFDHYLESKREAESLAVNTNQGSIGSSKSVANQVEKASDTFSRVMKNETRFGLPQQNSTPQEEAKLAELQELSQKHKVAQRLAQLKSVAKGHKND
jgi:phage shock protein A